MIIYIENNYYAHYEIIESILHHISFICKTILSKDTQIYLKIQPEESFIEYITHKYLNLNIVNDLTKPREYDYYIECTLNQLLDKREDFNLLTLDPTKHFYISHVIYPYLRKKKNVYFLTPICCVPRHISCTYLPFMDKPKIKTDIPIFLIAGNINAYSRNYQMLKMLLDIPTFYRYKIKLLGRSKDNSVPIGPEYNDRMIYCLNYNYIQYHHEFLDVYCVLPCFNPESNPEYYTEKISSTINYIKAYQLKSIVDDQLQSIHQLERAYVYHYPYKNIVEEKKREWMDMDNHQPKKPKKAKKKKKNKIKKITKRDRITRRMREMERRKKFEENYKQMFLKAIEDFYLNKSINAL